MAQTVGDFLVQRLLQWGTKRVFGYPGDGINGIMAAVERAQGELKFVQARPEEMAAFMACAHAKFPRQPGACIATTGPGPTPLPNGPYGASLDHPPGVPIVGPAP